MIYISKLLDISRKRNLCKYVIGIFFAFLIILLPQNAFAKDNYLSWGALSIGADKCAESINKVYSDTGELNKVKVAVLDTGIDYNHPFLQGRINSCKYDFVDSDNDGMDEQGHGTAVAGIIADATFDNVQINGYRIADKYGEATCDALYMGISKAISDKVDIINISLVGGNGAKQSQINKIYKLLDKAIANGIIVIIAAGNDGRSTDNVWLANYEPAITVSALGSDGKIASYSNYGKAVDVCAPGSGIYSTALDNRYLTFSGTSMSAAFVTAAVAMICSVNSSMDSQQIEEYLKSYALDLGATGFDKYYGYGKIDLTYVFGGKINNFHGYNIIGGTKIVWNRILGIKSFDIYRKIKGQEYNKIATIKGHRTCCTDTNAVNGASYIYKIVGNNKNIKTAAISSEIYRISAIEFSLSQKSGKRLCINLSQNSKVSGYHIKVSLDKNFTKNKNMWLSGNKNTKCTINNLTGNKTYYVKVRGYKNRNNNRYYSKWSEVISVKILK